LTIFPAAAAANSAARDRFNAYAALRRTVALLEATLQVTSEMLRVLRGERPHVLANPDVWARVGIR